MQLSQKQETFFAFLAKFLKALLNFEYVQRQDDSHGPSISEITDSEIHGQINV